MRALWHLWAIGFLAASTLSADIFLPALLLTNQSSSTPTRSLYLCHLHPLKNTDELFLQGYEVVNRGNTDYVHHLLLYECSSKAKLVYSGQCGMHNARLMPPPVYRHCQTRIIIAWAQGGRRTYHYPPGTALKLSAFAQLLLEVHFEAYRPSSHPVGLQLQFTARSQPPRHEIGVLTLGTLARSPLLLPPRLDSIRFPTYCFHDCLNSFLGGNATMHVFSVLVHAHRRATRITLHNRARHALIDRDPFEFHRQTSVFFDAPYPQVNSTDELSLVCYYSTRNDSRRAVRGGHESDDEMCQAFLYYYPKVESFPLCLSVPVYENEHLLSDEQQWTSARSLSMKSHLESNANHLSMCGDNDYSNRSNRTTLQTKLYRRVPPDLRTYPCLSQRIPLSLYMIVISLLCGVALVCSMLIKRNLHSFVRDGTL